MNLLRIHSWEGPTHGGGELQIEWANAELERRGHRVDNALFTTPDGGTLGRSRAYRAPIGPRSRLLDLNDHDALAYLRDAYASSAPDIVHLHHFERRFGPIAHFLREVDVPVVFTAHDAEPVCPISTLVLPDGRECEGGVRWRCQFTGCAVGWGLPVNLLERRLFDRLEVARFVCPSAAIQRKLDQNGYGPTTVVPTIVPDAETVERIGDPIPTVGFIGRLEPYKGLDVLLDAVERVASRLPVRLRVAGTGRIRLPERPWIVHDGWVSGADKEEWFRGIDVLAVPSQAWENFGIVAAEAVMRGIPALVNDLAGLPETVPAEWVVPRSGDRSVNALAWAERLERLLATDALSAARALAREHRVRLIGRHSASAHVDRILEVYRSLNEGIHPPGRAEDRREARGPPNGPAR